jgi:hypothetical protein
MTQLVSYQASCLSFAHRSGFVNRTRRLLLRQEANRLDLAAREQAAGLSWTGDFASIGFDLKASARKASLAHPVLTSGA